MNNIKTICVFASSSNNIDKIFFDDAQKLGYLIAKNNYDIVYGGSCLGLMGMTTKTAKDNGSYITGVMPEKLYNLGISPGPCSDFILTKGMRERKAKMDEISDAIIALPGGFGTLEEVSEMIVQKQLGYCDKPIIILNTAGYYNNLISFFNEMINKNFANSKTNNIFYIANTPEDTIEYLQSYKCEYINYIVDKVKN